jgi:hypothetical protein
LQAGYGDRYMFGLFLLDHFRHEPYVCSRFGVPELLTARLFRCPDYFCGEKRHAELAGQALGYRLFGNSIPNFVSSHQFERKEQMMIPPAESDSVPRPILGGMSIFTMLMTVPQVLTIWLGRQAAGVSVLSWSAYLVSAILWFWFGIQKKDKNMQD